MRAPTWSASCSFRRRRGMWRSTRRGRSASACAAVRRRWRSRSMPTMRCSTPIVEALQPDLLQLHGKETPARVAALKQRFGLPVMKAIAVAAKADLARRRGLCRASPTVCCSMRARRARRRGRAASANVRLAALENLDPGCRSCSRAASMPAMSARLAHHAGARRRCFLGRRARAGRKGSGQDPRLRPRGARRRGAQVASSGSEQSPA